MKLRPTLSIEIRFSPWDWHWKPWYTTTEWGTGKAFSWLFLHVEAGLAAYE